MLSKCQNQQITRDKVQIFPPMIQPPAHILPLVRLIPNRQPKIFLFQLETVEHYFRLLLG